MAAPAVGRARDVVRDDINSHAEEEDAPEARRVGGGDSEDDSSVRSGWGIACPIWGRTRVVDGRVDAVTDRRESTIVTVAVV